MNVARTFSRLLCCLLPILCGACAISTPQDVNAKYRDIVEAQRQQYEIELGDELQIRVYRGQVDLALQTVTVLPDGRADGFFLHNFKFAGKTAPAIEKEVREAYRDELNDPKTEISILVTPGIRQVVFNGHFKREGPIPYEPGMTLNDAMAIAGRMRITGDTDYALLRRRYSNTPGKPERFRVDLNDISEEIFLLPGDEVYLPPNGLALVIEYLREYVFGILPTGIYGGAVSALVI